MNTAELTAILCESGKRGLGLTSLAVLVHCAEHEGVILSKLAGMLGKSKATLTGIADKLQERDLVRRRSIRGGDRRTWTLELTDHGFGVLLNILSTNNTTLV
jgi:DNA-binding MarR family transcriptional regulator